MARATLAQNDRESFAGYVADQIRRWEDYNDNGNTHIWDTRKLAAADARHFPRPADTSDAGAWAGAWHTVRPFLTTEFADYIIGGMRERLTFSDWKLRAIAERDAENANVKEYLESAEYATEQLEDLRGLLGRRDSLIVTAWERGASMREIMAASGLGRSQLSNIRSSYSRAARLIVDAAEIAARDAAALDERDAAVLDEGPF
jgi:hypothetical protein